MTTRPIVILAVLAFVPSDACAQSPSGDLARLQGRWWTRIPSPQGNAANLRYMEIQGDRASALDARGNVVSVSRIVLDESQNPRTIDFPDAVLNHPQKGQMKQPDTHGVYELEGDVFRFAVTGRGDLTKRPADVAPDPLKGSIVMVFRRGKPPAESRVVTFERAYVFPSLGQTPNFRTGQDDVLITTPALPRAVDAEGRPIARPMGVLVPGNIVDVTVRLPDQPGQRPQIQEVRLVRGKVEPGGPEGAGNAAAAGADAAMPGRSGVYKGATITKVGPFKVTIEVNGKTVEIGRTNFDTNALDLKGNQLPSGQKQRLLKVGNKVDIELRPKNFPDDPDETPAIKSIKLLKGKLAMPGRP
jgi:uncharacterized protein (TIGR03067 family)